MGTKLLRQQKKKKKKYDSPKKVKKAPKQQLPKEERKEREHESKVKEEVQDYSELLEQIHAHDLKHGMYVIDDKSGYPGQVSNLKRSAPGKHGHAKFTYKLVMNHSGKTSNPMHAGKDQLQRPIMEKEECVFVRFMDDEQQMVEVKDGKGKMRVIAISPDPKVYEKVMTVMERRGKGETMLMTVLKGPKYSPKKVSLVECVIDVKKAKS